MGNKVKLGYLLSLLTDYHANGAYKKLKENVELFDEPDYAVMIRTTNFEQNNFDSNLKYISEHAYNFLEKSKVKAGDIIMNKIANAGSSYLMPDLNCPVSLAMNLFLLRIDEDKANSTFVYLYLKLNEDYVKSFANGSVTKTITKEAVRNLEIELPERSMQDYIVKVYMDYVSKLTLNQKTNQTLEQMAQALFKSWFVDFDPVFDNLLASVDFNLKNLETSLPDEFKLKAQRRLAALDSLENVADVKASLIALDHELQALSQTKEATQAAVQVSEKIAETPVKANFNATPNILAQHANTHAHFPREFEHNEQLGWIPKGWEKSQIQDLAKVVKGKSYKSAELSDSSTALVTLKSFKRGGGYRLDGLKGYTGKYKPEQEVFAGDLIVAYTDVTQAADVIGKPAMVISDTKYEHLVVSLDVAVVRCFNEIHKNYLYGVMKTDAFQNHSRSYTSGTTVLHLKKEAVPEYCLALPDNEILSAFLGVSAPLYEKIDRLIDENRALTKLRDTLLPKLISGELQIPDVTTDEEVVD